MLRRMIKTSVARALTYSYADKLIAACLGAPNIPFVIGYHRVVIDFASDAARFIPSMLISLRMMEHHLDWIGRRFTFVTLDDLASRLEEGRDLGKPAAAITFDDGYSDLYHHAFPLLRRKGIPAAVFVVSDLIGTSRLQICDELYLLLSEALAAWQSPEKRLVQRLLGLGVPPAIVERTRNAGMSPYQIMRELLQGLTQDELRLVIAGLGTEFQVPDRERRELTPLNWEMLSEMHRSCFTIGSHTMTHPLLTNETWQKIRSETEGSRKLLERNLGVSINHFAYPDGRFNAATIRAVRAAGYRTAYTTCRHRDSHYPNLSIPRQLLWERSCLDSFERFSPAVMRGHAHRVFEFMNACRQDHQ